MKNPKPDSNANDFADPELNRLFAERTEALPADEFMASLLEQVDRIRRRERQVKYVAVIAGIAAAAYGIKELLHSGLWASAASIDAWSSELFSLDTGVLMSLLESPMAWAILCAVAATTLPVIYVMKAWK